VKRRFLLAGAALASAACLALLPAAASATVLATKYTPSYAGYYDVVSFNRGTVFAVVDVPNFTALVKVTSWIDAEIWLYSPEGTYKFVLGADPQTESTYQPKIMLGTTRVATCSGSFPQGSMVDDRVILSRNSSGHNVIDWSFDGAAPDCVLTLPSGFSYTKVAVIGAFSAKSFRMPSSAVTLASFHSVWLAFPPTEGANDESIDSYPHGKFIATSTGTQYGTVRAEPVTPLYGLRNGEFSVVIP
jgi:hypothetical protein